MAVEHFCLKWNNFQTNIITNLENLKCNGDLVDVTLTCEGKSVKAHKVILSACSSYFRTIFKENPCSHPIVILKGVTHRDISSLISFMYQGEVHIQEDQLSSFLRTAEHLQIKGLADVVLPDEKPMSERFEWKELRSVDGRPGCASPEVLSPHPNSTFHPFSPSDAIASKPLQSMHVPQTHLPGVQGSERSEEGRQPWNVHPKMELIERESSKEVNSQRVYSIDWQNMASGSSASRLDVVQQRCLSEKPPFHSGHQDLLTSFPCPLCDKVISSKSNLQKHMKIRHSAVITQEVCVHCGKIFKNKYSLRYHSTYHCVMNRSPRPC